MKKFVTLLLALVMILSLAACGGSGNDNSSSAGSGDTNAAANTPDDAANTPDDTAVPEDKDTPADDASAAFTTLEAGKLHMSTEPSFPPYEMTTDDGGFEGIDVEIAEAIAEKLGLELVIDGMGFDAALTAVQTGQVDIAMAGITITEERKEVMDFSDSYATGVQVVIIREDNPAIQSLDDLASAALIGTQKATTGYLYCSDTPENGGYGEDHVVAFENGALAVMALVNGQVDCVVIDSGPAHSFVAENPGLAILDTEFAVEDYAIGFAKGNDALKDAVNNALVELMNDGTVQRIVDKYITAE